MGILVLKGLRRGKEWRRDVAKEKGILDGEDLKIKSTQWIVMCDFLNRAPQTHPGRWKAQGMVEFLSWWMNPGESQHLLPRLWHTAPNCATKCSSSTSVSTGDQQLPPRTAGWKMCNRAAPVKPLICKESWCHTTSHNTVNSQDESLSRRKTSGTEQTLSSKEESLWTAHRLRLKPKSATTPRTLL